LGWRLWGNMGKHGKTHRNIYIYIHIIILYIYYVNHMK
jgi:hypothetical protein